MHCRLGTEAAEQYIFWKLFKALTNLTESIEQFQPGQSGRRLFVGI
jgi:hypothetical protein